MRRRNGKESGSALLELALSFPMLLLILLGVCDFGRFFYSALTVGGAARAGAQFGVIDPLHATDVNGMRNAAAADAVNLTGVTVTARRYCQCGNGAEVACNTACASTSAKRVYVRVVAQQNFQALLTYPGITNPMRVKSTVSFRAQ